MIGSSRAPCLSSQALKLSGSLIVISMVLVGIILVVWILVKASILQVIQYVLVFTAASSRWPPPLAGSRPGLRAAER